MKVDDYSKFELNDPMLKGHTAPISDFEFNPFVDNLLATASEDGTAALWTIPFEGLTEDLKDPNATLYGHSKKLTHLRFNPTAANVLATTSFDKDIRIWDANTAKEAMNISGLIGQPTCLEWNYDGSMLAAVDKTKALHVFDPRCQAEATSNPTIHNGPKQLKCCWLGTSNRIVTTGTNKQMFKEIGVWDSRDLSNPIKIQKGEKNLEVSDPFYDETNNLIYCAVKGESRVNIYELADDSEVIHKVASWKGEGSHRGFNFFPKRFVDVFSSELMRAVRLTDKVCEYVSFGLPKKKGAFVPSLYGKCDNGHATTQSTEWLGGESVAPESVDINPELLPSLKLRTSDGIIDTTVEETKEPADNAAEIEEMKAAYQRQVTELEDKLKDAGTTQEDAQELEDLRQENVELAQKVADLENKIQEAESAHKLKEEELQNTIAAKEQQIQELLQNQTQAPPADVPAEEQPAETHEEAPVDAPVEAPVDAPAEAPADAPVDAPAEAPVDTPAEAPVDPPAEDPNSSFD